MVKGSRAFEKTLIYCNRGVIRIIGPFSARHVSIFLEAVNIALKCSYTELFFDFSKTTSAWSESMLPLIATADWLKANSCGVKIELPQDEELHRLFVNTSWAHYLDPARHATRGVNIDHFNTKRFEDAKQQKIAVDEIMQLAVSKLNLKNDVLTALEWSINEITDNALTHANSKAGGLVQVVSLGKKIIFCVADSGRGILASLREGHPELRNDMQAIGEAVKAGVTRNPSVGQGNGLAGTLSIAMKSGGQFSVVSHMGDLFVTKDNAYLNMRNLDNTFHGTVVTATIRTDVNFKIEDALGFAGAQGACLNILDYHDEQPDAMILHLADETSGVGSRSSGAFIREKCKHLLLQEINKPLILDWAGIPLISSSFADESLGKLFVELGPLVFGARIKHKDLNSINTGLIDKAIMQRVAQQIGSSVSSQERRSGFKQYNPNRKRNRKNR